MFTRAMSEHGPFLFWVTILNKSCDFGGYLISLSLHTASNDSWATLMRSASQQCTGVTHVIRENNFIGIWPLISMRWRTATCEFSIYLLRTIWFFLNSLISNPTWLK